MSDLEMREGEDQLWARGFIYVERESQKGILVGKQGSKIKSIVREAEEELNQLFPYRVKLDLRVKVKQKWRKNNQLLKKLIC
ncbi:GTPase Era [subsurface metagenome]